MDKLTGYRNAIKGVLAKLEDVLSRSPTTGVETLCAVDEERDQYVLLSTGWAGTERVRGITVYLRLRDGKVWLEEDNTDFGIAEELMKAGVPREDIVLGFQHPDMRRLTDFAVV